MIVFWNWSTALSGSIWWSRADRINTMGYSHKRKASAGHYINTLKKGFQVRHLPTLRLAPISLFLSGQSLSPPATTFDFLF